MDSTEIYKVKVWLEPFGEAGYSRVNVITSLFSAASAVSEHLALVFKHNKRWTKIQVLKGGKVVKEWVK